MATHDVNISVPNSKQHKGNKEMHREKGEPPVSRRKCILLSISALTLVLIFCIAIPVLITFDPLRTTMRPTTTALSTTSTATASTSTTTSSTTSTTTSTTSSTTTTTTTRTTTSTTSTTTSTSSSTTSATTSTSSSTTSTTTSTSSSTTSATTSTSSSTTSTTTSTTSSTTRTTTSTISTTISTTSSTTSTTTSSTTTQRPIVSLTNSGDTIIGLYNTTAGLSTGGFNGSYSGAAEDPRFAIDANTSTKYLNFGNNGCSGCIVYGPGIGTGFFITPSVSNATIARGLIFATGNDSTNRDPITVTLEGSAASTIAMLNQGSSWTLIYNGSTGISPTIDPGRMTYVNQQNFSNTTPFASYRLLITSQRGNDNSVQYSEGRIIGYV